MPGAGDDGPSAVPPLATAPWVELVTIGDELLLGVTTDTNGAYVARRLGELGISVSRRTTTGDDEPAIAAAVGEALARTGRVIVTGGLGPTSDDRTRQAVAALLGRQLGRDEQVAESLRERWRRIGHESPIPENNLAMAMVPDGARLLRNSRGAAPGLWLEAGPARWVALLPGVPSEMRAMLDGELMPLLRGLLDEDAASSATSRTAAGAHAPPAVIVSRTLRTTGVPESVLAQLLEGARVEDTGATLAYLPGREGVDLRLTARGHPRAVANRILADAGALLLERVGGHVYAEGDTDLAAVVLEACRARAWRVAVAESCTGGLLGARLTDPAGASDVLEGGVISYANQVKTGLLGVEAAMLAARGAVSEEVARQMSSGVRALLGVDVGVGITGVAGPGGGSDAKPVGTVWVALDLAGSVAARVHQFAGDRAEIRFRATQAALHMLHVAAR